MIQEPQLGSIRTDVGEDAALNFMTLAAGDGEGYQYLSASQQVCGAGGPGMFQKWPSAQLLSVALCGGMPPTRWRCVADLSGGLVGVEPMPSKRARMDADIEPAVPAAVRTDAAGQIRPDLVRGEGHPVDAAVSQSSAGSRHRVQVARQVLIGRNADPVGARRGHDTHDAGRPRRCHSHSSSTAMRTVAS